MITIAATPTSEFIATCKPCQRPVRWSDAQRPERYKTATTTCAQCGAALKGQRIYGTLSQKKCDASCQMAKGSKCMCSCRGDNHGMGFNPVIAGKALAGNLGLYRVKAAKRSEAAKKAAATRAAAKAAKLADAAKAVTAFQAEHAPLVAWMQAEGSPWLARRALRNMDKYLEVPGTDTLTELYAKMHAASAARTAAATWAADNADLVTWLGEQTGEFFRDMHHVITQGHLLTVKQEAAVRRIYAEHLATKDIPALEAGRQLITGTVQEISVEAQEQGGYYGITTYVHKMQIRTPEGQLVKVTATDTIKAKLDGLDPDLIDNDAELERVLVGKQVQVKATVKVSYNKQWTGWGSRPSGFALV